MNCLCLTRFFHLSRKLRNPLWCIEKQHNENFPSYQNQPILNVWNFMFMCASLIRHLFVCLQTCYSFWVLSSILFCLKVPDSIQYCSWSFREHWIVLSVKWFGILNSIKLVCWILAAIWETEGLLGINGRQEFCGLLQLEVQLVCISNFLPEFLLSRIFELPKLYTNDFF